MIAQNFITNQWLVMIVLTDEWLLEKLDIFTEISFAQKFKCNWYCTCWQEFNRGTTKSLEKNIWVYYLMKDWISTKLKCIWHQKVRSIPTHIKYDEIHSIKKYKKELFLNKAHSCCLSELSLGRKNFKLHFNIWQINKIILWVTKSCSSENQNV